MESAQTHGMKSDRRGFLKIGATMGASLIAAPGIQQFKRRRMKIHEQ